MFISNLNVPAYESKSEDKNIVFKTSTKVPCRDPFIMLIGDTYYLYKSGMSEVWGTDKQKSREISILCYKSKDLENWYDPKVVLNSSDVSHGVKDMFWAPECHYYKGYYYIFTSVFSSHTNHRCISVYRSESPEGPFTDIAGGFITPKEWDTIDGTLYIDEENKPWMVFVHEWTSMPEGNGSMAAARLSEDFTHFISEPINLFYARDAKWASSGVTDGPYLYRSSEGKLMMIWSNFSEKGYCVGLASSVSGKVEGPWVQSEKPIYEKDLKEGFKYEGGHAMIFKDKEANLKITFHAPNGKTPDGDFEHVIIRDIKETNSKLEIR